jgi:hypothetical protein
MLGGRNHMYSGQYVADRLRRLGFPELADVALRLPDAAEHSQDGHFQLVISGASSPCSRV